MTSSSPTIVAAQDLPSVFSDLQPIPQDDGKAVCRIDYPEDFILAYDYFRAVVQAEEKSDRALQLTALCLKLNPANYTVWHYRRQCLFRNTDEKGLVEDLALAAALGGENPKNYQLWYHRRALVEHVRDHHPQALFVKFCRRELDYTASVFTEDSKNYHSWCFRQWVVHSLSALEDTVWSEELEFASTLILQDDVRNNSAWNQRWFAAHCGVLHRPLELKVARTEADFALAGAKIDPYNECPWRYLIAVLKEQGKSMESGPRNEILDEYLAKTEAVKDVLIGAARDPQNCSNLAAACVDLHEMKGDRDSLANAQQLTIYLSETIDPIRQKYWAFRSSQIEEAIKAL